MKALLLFVILALFAIGTYQTDNQTDNQTLTQKRHALLHQIN